VSIALQPEMIAIIEKYKGTETLLDFGYKFSNYRNFLRLVNCALKRVGQKANVATPLTTYLARHSWATIAHKLKVSIEVIDYVLGHSLKGMAMKYIHLRYEIADEAIRIVLDALIENTKVIDNQSFTI
jgi:integrase